MSKIVEFFNIVFQFAYDFMHIPINIYGFEITMWAVFIFVFLGGVLFSVACDFFE